MCNSVNVKEVPVYTLTYLKTDSVCPENCAVSTQVFMNLAEAIETMEGEYIKLVKSKGDEIIKLKEYQRNLNSGTVRVSAEEILDETGISKCRIHHGWIVQSSTIKSQETAPVVPEIRVKTPAGTLIACNQQNPCYPGIMVDFEFEGEDGKERIGIANIEWGEDTNDDKRKLFVALFRDAMTDDCTDYLPVDDKNALFSGITSGRFMRKEIERPVVQNCKVNLSTGEILGVNVTDEEKAALFIEVNGEWYAAKVKDGRAYMHYGE